MGAALAPLVGLAASAGVALSAAAQGAGVLALASAGVADALKEQIKAQGAAGATATKNADQHRNAARSITAAEDGLTDAKRNARQAEQALSEARVQARADIYALKIAVDDARQSQTDATKALSDAERGIADAQQGSTDAQEALTKARAEAASNIADLQAAVTETTHAEELAERSLEDAQDRVTSSVQSSADAQRDLTQARADAQRQIEDLKESVDDTVRAEQRAANALTKAQERLAKVNADPKASASDRVDAALDLADAQDQVSDSARDHADAVKASTDADAKGVEGSDKVVKAQSAVVKAAKDEKDAVNGVADAQWGVTKARNAQAEAITASTTAAAKGVEGSAAVIAAERNVRDAAQAVVDAQKASADATRDLADAHLDLVKAGAESKTAQDKGIAGSDKVVAATESVAAANRAVRDAVDRVKDAQLDAAAATTAMSATLDTANQKFDALPPTAQDFVTALVNLKPKFDDLRQTAAAGLFPGVVDGITAASRNFGPLKKVVGETAGVLGDLATKAGDLVGSAGFGRDIETIGHRNAIILDRVGGGALHLVSAFRHVVIAAGPLTTWLAKVFEGWAKGVDDAAEAGRKSGDLADFFQKTRSTLIRVVSIVKNLGEAFFNVGKEAAPFGRDILASLDKVSGRFKEWTETVGGQKALQEFFRDSRDLAGKLMPALGGILESLGSLAFSVLPAYVRILEALGPLAGPLVQAFILYKVALTGVTIATGLATAATKLASAAQWLFRDALIVTRIQLAALWVQTKVMATATAVMTGAQWLLNAALTANPIGLVVVAIGALVAGLIIAYKKSETFREIVDAISGAMVTAAAAVWGFVTDITSIAEKLLAAGNWIVDKLIEGVKALGGAIGDAAGWVKDRLIEGLKSFGEGYKAAGSWVIDKIVEGAKSLASPVVAVGGWIKNRVAEGIDALKEVFKGIGGDPIKWIIEGFKAYVELTTGVGGWIKNRVNEGIQGAVEGFKSAGSWALERVVDGLTQIPKAGEGILSVGGWIKNRMVESLGDVKQGIMDIGGTIIGWIISGLKKGAYELQEFLNKIIHVINKIPGVEIGDIDVLKKDKNGDISGMARGGAYGRTGGVVDSPIVMMGEEAPTHPEFVIPTNPAYRGRAKGLLAQAAGAIGLADGGVVSAFKGAIKDAKAGPKASLALFEAGLVESELQNLPGGHADSRGVLQIRDSTAGPMGVNNMDPMASAMAFLTRGFWGKGSANTLSRGSQSAGWVAQQVQGSAYPERYDLRRNDALAVLGGDSGGGGGIVGAIKGAVGKVTGIVGDLISGGAGFLTKMLPDTDSLGWLAGTGKHVLSKITEWIKGKVSALIPGGGDGGGGGGTSTGPKGVGTFEGIPMANWVIGALQHARSKGFKGQPTSGFRTQEEQDAIRAREPRAAKVSEHTGTHFPHGAVDFGGFSSGKAIKDAFVAAVADYKYPLVAPRGFQDDGHASGSGHANGGLVRARVGEMGPEDVYMPQGSRVVPNYMTQQGAGKDGITIDMRGAHIGSQRAARVMAEKLAFRVAFG